MTTSPMQRIKTCFLEFQQGIKRCKSEDENISGDLKDAYNRLSRLRDRYLHEKRNLTTAQNTALSKAFENDVFIKGLCELRQVGEHVVARRPEGIKIFTTDNVSLYLDASCSAGTVFSDNNAMLKTADNYLFMVDHLKNLEEAEKRIEKALNKAE